MKHTRCDRRQMYCKWDVLLCVCAQDAYFGTNEQKERERTHTRTSTSTSSVHLASILHCKRTMLRCKCVWERISYYYSINYSWCCCYYVVIVVVVMAFSLLIVFVVVAVGVAVITRNRNRTRNTTHSNILSTAFELLGNKSVRTGTADSWWWIFAFSNFFSRYRFHIFRFTDFQRFWNISDEKVCSRVLSIEKNNI